MAEETSASGCHAGALRQALAGEDTAANAALYVLLRAVDRFRQTYQRYPGVYDRCEGAGFHAAAAAGCCSGCPEVWERCKEAAAAAAAVAI